MDNINNIYEKIQNYLELTKNIEKEFIKCGMHESCAANITQPCRYKRPCMKCENILMEICIAASKIKKEK